MAREVTQPPRVTVLGLALDKGGKKHAELHLINLLAETPFRTAANQPRIPPGHGRDGRAMV